MDFLFKDRGSGKRAIKPSKEAEILEAMIPDRDSDDSDFELEKHDSEGQDSDDDRSSSASDNDGSDNEDSSSDSEEEVDEDEVLRLKSNLTTEELISMAARQSKAVSSSGTENQKVCGTCLGTHSDHTNEIVECDGCGVAVHEACYGIQEMAGGSINSNASSACTEPWFCEPCMAGVSNPHCEVCPNVGGIYKETDTGSWIHLVCGLYIPQISFFDQERITRPTLFELNYQSWGRRACDLCKNIKFARTGICVECDAGMCKSYFHVTCAQEAGLLSEPSEDDHEQFFGHCKAHSDKEQIKRRRKNWLTHQLSYRQRGALIMAEREADKLKENSKESPAQRNLRKLSECRERWLRTKQKDHWLPTQKMSRLLLTSNKAIKKFQRKAELQEWNMDVIEEEEYNKQVVAEIRKKWNVAPAFTVEYVAYYHDRAVRIKEMQETLAEAVMRNNTLREEDDESCLRYRNLSAESETVRGEGTEAGRLLQLYSSLLVRWDPQGRGLSSPARTKTPARLTSPRGGGRHKVGELHNCQICQSSSDQHLLVHCDICHLAYHLHCLNPPLSKMPKKTKQYGWQCSECDKDPGVLPISFTPEVDLEAPRSSRARGSHSRLGSMILSDSETESLRNSRDSEALAENLVKSEQEKKATTVEPVESKAAAEAGVATSSAEVAATSATSSTAATASTAATSSTAATAGAVEVGSPVTPSGPKKRGRPVGWRKYKDGESPPAKPKRSRKSKSSVSSPLVVPAPGQLESQECVVTSTENMETPGRASDISNRVQEGSSDISNRKQEESSEPLNKSAETPPILPPKKFFKSKAALKDPTPANVTVSPPPSPPNHEHERDNFRTWLDAKLAGQNGLESEEPFSKADGSEDSSGDDAEVTPDKNGSLNSDKEDKEARKERKRLKRESKEKRREERRKKKLLKNQDMLFKMVEVPDRPTIEEDEDCCVVRIAPKPIKIKLKPIPKPDDLSEKPSDFAIVNSEEENGDITRTEDQRERSLSPVTNMHPKKKLAHMTDSLVNNFPVVNNILHSTLTYLPPINHHNSTPAKLQTPPTARKAEPNNILSIRNGLSERNSSSDDLELMDCGDNKISNSQKSPVKPAKKTNNENSVKKGRDVRTKCDVCLGEGTNANLVRCDECLKCYHFGCLNPPVKKTPKVSGWAWSCSDCAPSDEDKGWHL